MISSSALLITYVITTILFISNVYGIAVITALRNVLLLPKLNIGTLTITSEGLITFMIIICGFYSSVKYWKKYFNNTSVNAFIFFIAIIASITICNYDQSQTAQSIIKLSRLLGYMFLYLMIVNLSMSDRNRNILNNSIIFSMLITVIPALILRTHNSGYNINPEPVTGFMSKNNFGFYSCYMTLFSIYYFYVAQSFGKRLIGITLIGIGALSLVLSYTRTAWIAFIVALILYLIMNRAVTKNIVLIMSIMLVGALSSAVLYKGLIVDPNKKREVGMSSMEFRFKYAWPASIKAFKEKPYLGYGLGNNLKAMQSVSKLANTSHSDYLVVLVETGIVGLTAYMLLLSALFIRTYKSIKYTASVNERFFCLMSFSVFAAFLVGSIAEHLIQTPGATGYVITLIAMSHGIAKKYHERSLIEVEEPVVVTGSLYPAV